MNTYKTILQLKTTPSLAKFRRLLTWEHIIKGDTPYIAQRLLQGADAQFFMSLPHGAFYFVVIENTRKILQVKFSELVPITTQANELTFLQSCVIIIHY